MAGLSIATVALCLGVIFIGATVQGVAGIGMGLVATPLLVVADPAFVPGGILIGILPLSALIVLREHRGIDWRGIRIGLVGRIPGNLAGAAAVAAMSDTALAVAVGAVVLAGVVMSATRAQIDTTTRTVMVAGFASGFGGTTVGIGGPPMALAYQQQRPAVVRSTLAVFFFIGSTISITVLVASGSIGGRETQLGLMMVPAVLGGFVASRVVNRFVKPSRLRPVILVLSAASALVLLIGELR